VHEMETCEDLFYSLPNTLRRLCGSVWHRRKPLVALVANLSFRRNIRRARQVCREFLAARQHRICGDRDRPGPGSERSHVPQAACAAPVSSTADA